MKATFWHDRWEKNQIGFHQMEINPRLACHWPNLGLERDASVFVPLCGKSLDMHWLRERGHPIIGVDLSPIAIRDFFGEAGIRPSLDAGPKLDRSSVEGFDLYCGDFFDLNREDLASIRACYDRGSLIALPPELRIRYAKHLSVILPPRMTILMITIEYDASKMSGPPYSVPPKEIEDLFGREFEIESLWSSGWIAAPERFRARGLEERCDTVLQLDRGN